MSSGPLLLLLLTVVKTTGLHTTTVTSLVGAVNVTSVVDDPVTLPCHTTLDKDVDWLHKDTPTSGVYYVYSNAVVYDIFKPRFTVDRRPDQGDYDLVISPVQLADSGLYICIDDMGLGKQLVVYQLTVLPVAATTRSSTSADDVDDEDDDDASVVVVVVVVVLLVIIATVTTFVVVVVVVRQRRRQRQNPSQQKVLLPDAEQARMKTAQPSNTDLLSAITARIADLEDGISRKREEEEQLNQHLNNGHDARRNLQEQAEQSRQRQEHLHEETKKLAQGGTELSARLDRVKSKENDLKEQTQKKSDKVKQVRERIEELKETTSGLEAHLKKQVHRQEDIEDELKEIESRVEQESEKRKSKEVLGRLRDLAERENSLQVELKEVRYLKVEIPRSIKENLQRETDLKEKLIKVEGKESDFAEKLRAKTHKREQIELELSTSSQTEARLKAELEVETETGNRVMAQLQELDTDIKQKEQELRSVKDEIAQLMSELEEAKLEETKARDLAQSEREKVECLEAERGSVSVRDETLESLVDEVVKPAHSKTHDASQLAV